MSRTETIWEQMRWDLLALLVLIVVAGGWAILQEPTFQPSESPTSEGSKPPHHSEGDVLLVLPTAPPAEARDIETLDCTFGWFNALRQHFGTFATTDADNVSPQLLAGHSVAVVPARVASEVSTSVREHLAQFARNGGQLIVEMPRDGAWASITGVAPGAGVQRARSITAAEGLGDHGAVREHLLDVPLAGHRLQSPELEHRPSGPVVFDVEEDPGLIAEPLDDGMVYALMFDFACSLTAMYQGHPTEDLRFGSPDEPDVQFLSADERVGDEALLDGGVPYATVLKRALFDRLSEPRPTARLWPYPDDYSGAAMTTHPAPESPRPAFAFADRARKQDAGSTIIAAADRFTADHAAVANQTNADVGLLWILGERRDPITEGAGLGAIQPWQRELNLPRQHGLLAMSLQGDDGPRLVQTEESMIHADWDTTFRKFTAAGLDIDTSFGPTKPDQWGYLFGTGMPFHPLDTRGRPLPVLEMPYALGGANLTTARLSELLEKSESEFHQPITVNLGADAMARKPSVGLMAGFRDFHDLSRQHHHWVTTVGDFVDFQSARRRSVLTSQWSEPRRRLTVSVNLIGARLDSAPDGAVATVALPAHHDGEPIKQLDVDDDEITLGEPTATGPGDEVLVELPPGRHVLTVYYHSPDDDEDEEDDGS